MTPQHIRYQTLPQRASRPQSRAAARALGSPSATGRYRSSESDPLGTGGCVRWRPCLLECGPCLPRLAEAIDEYASRLGPRLSSLPSGPSRTASPWAPQSSRGRIPRWRDVLEQNKVPERESLGMLAWTAVGLALVPCDPRLGDRAAAPAQGSRPSPAPLARLPRPAAVHARPPDRRRPRRAGHRDRRALRPLSRSPPSRRSPSRRPRTAGRPGARSTRRRAAPAEAEPGSPQELTRAAAPLALAAIIDRVHRRPGAADAHELQGAPSAHDRPRPLRQHPLAHRARGLAGQLACSREATTTPPTSIRSSSRIAPLYALRPERRHAARPSGRLGELDARAHLLARPREAREPSLRARLRGDVRGAPGGARSGALRVSLADARVPLPRLARVLPRARLVPRVRADARAGAPLPRGRRAPHVLRRRSTPSCAAAASGFAPAG